MSGLTKIFLSIILLELCAEGLFFEDSIAGFKKIGNYYISDGNNKSNLKIYFISMAFRANWMNSQSFCKSFGMDLVALESEHERNYFIKSCEKNLDYFEQLVQVGGVFTINEGWSWISSNEKIGLELNLEDMKNSKNVLESNCLQLKKSKRDFCFARVQCSENKLQQFVCQKMIIKKNNWTNYFRK